MLKGKWIGGLAQWEDGDNYYLSIAFTWELDRAYSMALFARACGKKVIAGGPGLFLAEKRHILEDIAEVPTKMELRKGKMRKLPADYPDAIRYHNPSATFASRGCDVGCDFCIVPTLEGETFTLVPDFIVRPILCDNNLSGLPAHYQDYIIERYKAEGVPLLDANSGFEPRTFTADVYARWAPLINAGRGPWRFAYDEMQERTEALAVMKMLEAEPAKRKRVYCMIGKEPYAECMQRIQEIIDHGCEPHVQPYMKLSAGHREPYVYHDWTRQKLKDVARWANGFVWKKAPFEEYNRSQKNAGAEAYDAQQGLFI